MTAYEAKRNMIRVYRERIGMNRIEIDVLRSIVKQLEKECLAMSVEEALRERE